LSTATQKVGEAHDTGSSAVVSMAVIAFLECQRETLAVKCAGRTAAQPREPAVPPSALSLLGLVRHMAEVEQSSFRLVMSGQPIP
jgi:hypothetical protein